MTLRHYSRSSATSDKTFLRGLRPGHSRSCGTNPRNLRRSPWLCSKRQPFWELTDQVSNIDDQRIVKRRALSVSISANCTHVNRSKFDSSKLYREFPHEAETGLARRLPSRSAGRTQPGRVRAAILPGSYRAREAAPDCGWSIAARPRPRSEWTRPAGDRGTADGLTTFDCL